MHSRSIIFFVGILLSLTMVPTFSFLQNHVIKTIKCRSKTCPRLANFLLRVQDSTSWGESPYFESSQSPSLSQDAAKIMKLCAYTNRGTAASPDERIAIEQAIRALEATNPTDSPADSPLLNGEWRLVYSPEASVTRASPFFWSFRKALRGVEQPLPLLPRELSEALFAVTD